MAAESIRSQHSTWSASKSQKTAAAGKPSRQGGPEHRYGIRRAAAGLLAEASQDLRNLQKLGRKFKESNQQPD
jgi:hypothetical protein